MKNTWFTSDSHFYHSNICRGTSSWDDKEACRGFESIEEMNYTIINNLNENVKQDDILYHCGDWSFGGFDNIMKAKKQIVCQNIHLILGNHDHHIERNKQGIQGAFKSVQHYKEIVIDNQLIILTHYAFRVWNKSHKGSWNLYGHSHGTLPDDPHSLSMDCGVDTNFMLPYSFEEIKHHMSKKDYRPIDHHSHKTN